ncbi:LacI family transcriptional regulator [Sporanaerobium hydrogeniformans]|uniref:LacI family transcriptional regulator n=1 Tax=Sporanaerobium hydrogeniformans TaxID=3072179 RepID=A0AC61DCL0_9FIRM|nr:LacI family DNA-binding transcriptional regulator [Sporanaerobium hydrogeniformans]PHV70312.1 LacI family transcriptional regulator [Sporanaerobium hydrogeniformans]
MNIKDIAQIAGVGVSTVSRVLNNHPDVKTETRDKVLAIMKENNYVPNNSARVLKQTNTKNIGVLVRGVFNPFFSELLKKISVGVEAAGYTMIIEHYSNEDDIDTLVGFIKEKRLQGVICLGGNFINLSDESFESVTALNVGIILVSVDMRRQSNFKRFSSISIHNLTAAYEATQYLIHKGHQNIAILLGDACDLGIGKRRYEGYKKALKEYNLAFKEEYTLYGYFDFEKAYKAVQAFLTKHKEVTAFFAISDSMAVGAAKAISDLGYQIGKDISIIGFDGMDIAKFYNPSITTIKQPKEEMAKLSVELLLGILERDLPNQHVFLDVKLLEGGSCTAI